jgi:hypothetical protein
MLNFIIWIVEMLNKWMWHTGLSLLQTAYLPMISWVARNWFVLLIMAWSTLGLWLVAHLCGRPVFRFIACSTLFADLIAFANNDCSTSLDQSLTHSIGNLIADTLNASGIINSEAIVEGSGKTASFPGIAAFGALLVGFLYLYRRLEIINARRTLPEIRVEEVTDEQGKRQHGLEGLLRESIFRAAPHAPSVHAAGGIEYIFKFLDKEPIGPSSHSWIGKAAAFVFHLVVPSRALSVRATLVAKKSGNEYRGIAISVKEEWSQKLVISESFREKNIQDAVESAAYRVAEYAILQCPTLPKWAHWSTEVENSAFLNYWRGLRESNNPEGNLENARKKLEKAARESRESVLARLQLAAVMEAQECYVDAIEIYLAVTSRYNLLFDARYRLAVLLGKIGWYFHKPRNHSKKSEEKEQLVERLNQAFKTHKVAGLNIEKPIPQGGSHEEFQVYFAKLAYDYWNVLIRDFQWLRLAWRSMRSTADRRYLWPRFLWNSERRKAAIYSMKIAQLCDKILLHYSTQADCQYGCWDKNIEELATLAEAFVSTRKDPRQRVSKGWWGLPHYNLACFTRSYCRLHPGESCALHH